MTWKGQSTQSSATLMRETERPMDEMIIEAVNKNNAVPPEIVEKFIVTS